ncbi:MAG: extracellular solute-binding protein [Alphaproteobacteria bacterium]|nr:extracellular solute-binding protein [Alphaproteobacteria bacterium]
MAPATLNIAIRKFGPFEQAIKQQFEDFRHETDVDCKLELTALDLDPHYETLFGPSGLKDGSIDMGLLVTDWLPMAATDGHLLNLAPLIEANSPPDYPHGWCPSLIRLQQIEGGVFGLPYHDGPQCLIYRKDLFETPEHRDAFKERFSRSLQPPASWDDYLDIVRYFRDVSDIYGTVLAAFPDAHNTVYDFCIQVWSRGGEITDQSGRSTLLTSAAEAALDFYRTLAKRDGELIYPDPRSIDSVRSGEIFADGKIALMTNWFGFAAYAASHPDSQVKDLIDIAPIPAGSGGAGAATSLNIYWVLAIGAGCRHPDLAYSFIRHCTTPAMDKLTSTAGAIGCRRSTWNAPEIQAAVPFYAGLEALHADARELPSDPRFPELAHIIDDLVSLAITTDTPSAELLASAQAKVKEKFADEEGS